MANTTTGCPLPKNWEEFSVNPVKILGPFTLRHLLFLFSIACAGITTLISLFLITKHLHRYTEPKQQRQIVRIIFTPVVFAVLSALSILSYSVAKYLQPLIDLYEAFALASLFMLYIEYVAPDEHARRAYFSALENRKLKSKFKPRGPYTVVPGGSLKWYHIGYVGVFIYCVVGILLTALELVTEATNRYCESSWKPKYAHIWVEVLGGFFLGWAINSIIGFYGRFKKEPEFAMHKPGLKLASFKLIVFVNFVQSIVFSILLSNIKTSRKMTGYDLKYGIPAALVAVEQIFFATFFHYSFRSREYHETMKEDLVSPRMGTFRAAANAFNPTDLLMGMFTAVRLLVIKFSGRGGAQPVSGPRGRRAGPGDDAHLEPMAQRPFHSSNPYSGQPTGIIVTEPQQTGYSNAYTGSEYAAYAPLAYPSNAAYEGHVEAENERWGLNPHGYARTHSREPSVDAISTRQMV